jgi:hypothetical protein
MSSSMSEKPPSDVLGALPRTRPHRRSDKRKPAAAAPDATAAAAPPEPKAPVRPARRPRAERLRQPAQPAGTPDARRARKPAPPNGIDLVGTAVQAAAELAEIGISISARAIRSAVSRLPHR